MVINLTSIFVFVVIIALIIISLLSIILNRLREITKELKRLEQRWTRSQQTGLSQSDQEIIELLNRGKKILAIKKAREYYGLSLKEAKDYVERL